MEYKEYKFDSYRILTIKTTRFKNCHIDINFLDDANEINMPLRVFLAELMTFTTQKYPTKRELLIALEELYNSSYIASCSRIGKSFVTSFSFDFLDPVYVKEENYLNNCVEFLCDALLNPHLNEKEVDKRSFNIIKERLLSKVNDYKENALNYAIIKSRQKLFSEDILKKQILGEKEDIEQITEKMIIEDYKRLFKNATVDILIIGNLDMDSIVNSFKEKFSKQSIVEREYEYFVKPAISLKKEIVQPSKYVQTQLLMYLQFNDITAYEANVVSLLYRQILGNADHSDKLAMYLREQNSLCYYRGIRANISDQYLLVYTGLKYDNRQEAIKLIKKALREMEQGDIEVEYLEQQKEKMLSVLKMNEYNEYYLIDNYYMHKVFNKPLVSELKRQIMDVTIEDIKNFAKKLSLTMVYVLKEQD